MTFSYLYLLAFVLWLFGYMPRWEESDFPTTALLLAFGIVSICNRLDKIIKKK